MKTNHPRTTALFVAFMLAIASMSNICHGQPTNRVLAYTNTAYVTIPSSPKLQNASQMTVEAWVFPISDYVLFSKSDGLNVFSDRSYEMGSGPNSMGGSFFLGSSVWAGCVVTNVDGFKNKWTHEAMTFDSASGTIKLYLNGVLAASATNDWGGTIPLAGLTVRQSSQPLILGYDNPVSGPGVTGLVDEVRVWSVARSASEIQTNMYQRLTGTEANLEGYWNFDAGTAADSTANHLHGTFYSGATTIIDSIPVSVQISVASVAISFPTGSPLTTYQVQYSTNVATGNWINLGSPMLGNGAIQSLTDSVYGQSSKFYRVIFY